jgi:hypothetical protein
MLRGPDAFLTELGLERSGPRADQWADDPRSKMRLAGLNHDVLLRMLESAENLAPFLKLSREVVFDLPYDLVIEEAERAPFGLVAVGEGSASAREQATPGSMILSELLAEAARMADARRGSPRVPEWAVPLDGKGQSKR